MPTPADVMKTAAEVDKDMNDLRELFRSMHLTPAQQIQFLARFQSSWEKAGLEDMTGHPFSDFLYGNQTAWNIVAERLSGDEPLLS